MSTAETIRKRVLRVQRGEPFTNTRFLKLGSRTSVDKTLSRLVGEGITRRITRGVFMRPKESRFIGNVMPDVSKVIEVMARDHGETIQVHGAEAARRFKLVTQVPTTPVFYTSGPTRELKNRQSESKPSACQPSETPLGWKTIGIGTFCFVVSG